MNLSECNSVCTMLKGKEIQGIIKTRKLDNYKRGEVTASDRTYHLSLSKNQTFIYLGSVPTIKICEMHSSLQLPVHSSLLQPSTQ